MITNLTKEIFIKLFSNMLIKKRINILFIIAISSLLQNNIFSTDSVKYYKKSDPEYENLRKGFNKRIDKYPKIIALCLNTKGVSQAIKYAIKNKLPIAIKSGGHCLEGFSCNDGGMAIDLSQLNQAKLIDDKILITEPGAKISQLYDLLIPKGKIIPAGSCAGVGIGGLTLGGGYGILSREFGLTCDSLIEIIMVDGKGNIHNSCNNKELLWACKGGGNGNFGVITSMKFNTHKVPSTLESFRFRCFDVDTKKAKNILKKWFEITNNLPITCYSAFVLNGKKIYILLTNTGKALNESLIVQRLSSICEKTTHIPHKPLAEALKMFYGQKGPLYCKNASSGLYNNFDDIESFIGQAIDIIIATPGMLLQINTLGGNIKRKDFQELSSFPHRSFNYISELQTYWNHPKKTEFFLKKFQDVQNIFANLKHVAHYRNYPDINFKNWENAYCGKNYKRLQKIKRLYDPENIFRYEQSIKL